METDPNGWVLLCSALAILMTVPGLALFYGGMLRKKNVLSVMCQCLALTSMMSILWACFGYSLTFSYGGTADAILGGSEHLFLNGVQREWDEQKQQPIEYFYAERGRSTRLSKFSHFLFQGTFFVLAPAIMCGAFAERMKFRAIMIFSALWGTLVFCPLAHSLWGGGFLSYGESGLLGGSLDFAGGMVVHLSSGVSALMAALIVGPRMGFRREPMPPHNLTYTAVGASLLWFGWLGMNAGSRWAADGLAASAFAVTHLAAASGAIAWAMLEWFSRGKPSILGLSSGCIAGLVCSSGCAGFIQPMTAIGLGAFSGLACYLACSWLKGRLRYDDALDAFGLHGIGGLLGAIGTGLFATRACWNIGQGSKLGWFEGGEVLSGQSMAIFIVGAYSAVVSVILLKLIDWTVGLRVAASDERQGLDLTQHGEEGYIFL